uniref:RRM domain-containing protein n=1 Tax=Kalanchoe fedtschenkoi TaxID=63787 RepID=A0A7N0T9G9_KALFE
MRGRSYIRSPSRSRGGYGKHRSDREHLNNLLVRNLHRECRPEDLRRSFDVDIPMDNYTGEPQDFGCVQYFDSADTAKAKYEMHGQILQSREVTVIFAGENKKKPIVI